MTAHSIIPALWEYESGGPGIQGQPWPRSKSEVILDYMRPCLKDKTKNSDNNNLKTQTHKTRVIKLNQKLHCGKNWYSLAFSEGWVALLWLLGCNLHSDLSLNSLLVALSTFYIFFP